MNVCGGAKLLEAAGPIKLAPGLYLAGASNPGKGVMRFSLFDQSKLNVASEDVAQMGVSRHLDWVWPVAEVALFEGECLLLLMCGSQPLTDLFDTHNYSGQLQCQVLLEL